MKIKKMLALAIVAVFLTGCGNENSQETRIDNGIKTVDDILKEQTSSSEESSIITESDESLSAFVSKDPIVLPAENTSSGLIDIDLTKLSSTLVYSEVFNMVSMPDQYFGKTVKMKGSNSVFIDNTTNTAYYSCIIKDATACCANGIEYELLGAKSLEEYPDDGEEITITGTFSSYEENGSYYLVLTNATLE